MIQDHIQELKTEKNAVILAHNYQPPEIQDVADAIGDSLELAIRAKEATEDIIVFCGVEFMAETAKILNPDKKVLMPVREAGCPLADHLTPQMITEAKAAHPGAAVVVYVNSTAECKALADIACTSANAAKVVKSLPNREVIFGPDANLAYYVQKQVPDKQIIPLPETGHCYVHNTFTVQDVMDGREKGSMVICHPECPPEVQREADIVGSTGAMVREAGRSDCWTLLTEKDMAYRLRTLFPEKKFFVKDSAVCTDMKKITLHELEHALEAEVYEITLPEDVMKRARNAIERMIAIR